MQCLELGFGVILYSVTSNSVLLLEKLTNICSMYYVSIKVTFTIGTPFVFSTYILSTFSKISSIAII